MSPRPSLPSTLLLLLTLNLLATLGTSNFYPELRSDLQKYQDTSRCYPRVGEWYLMYRNYYEDAAFGGTAKCVKFNRYGKYEHFSTSAILTFGGQGSVTGKVTLSSTACYVGKNRKTFAPYDDNVTAVSLHAIYMDCATCFIARHPYAANGQGCTYWRRSNVAFEQLDCCDFIYDQNCGTAPKYKMYDSTCTSEVTTIPQPNSTVSASSYGTWLDDGGY